MVTLYVRVWIETVRVEGNVRCENVTLYVRVWIETWRRYQCTPAR